jgi:hypothetical protein
MGQRNVKGSYPLHFHMLGYASDSYVRDCAVYRSFYRGAALPLLPLPLPLLPACLPACLPASPAAGPELVNGCLPARPRREAVDGRS